VVAAFALAATSPAGAQADPGSVERTIPKLEVKPAPGSPRVAAPVASRQQNARIGGTFVLGAVNIEGATVFSSAELAQSFEPYLASRVGQAQLDKIAADITARYRRAGYLLSYAVLPAQSVASGIVNIRVVEGFIADVRVEGDARTAAAVGAVAAQLHEDRPLRTSALERVLGIIRDMPGVTVSDTRISRSAADPVRHELIIVVRGDRVRGLAYSDNRGTIAGARLRGYSSLSIGSLAFPGDQAQLDLFTIPGDDFRYFYGQAKLSVPLNRDGLRFTAAGSRGQQFQRVAGPDIHGKSRQLAAELSYPFTKTRAFALVGHVSVGDWMSEEKRQGSLIQRDRFQFARAWIEVARASSRLRLDGRFAISQGLDLGSGTTRGDVLATRPFGGAKFTKFNADVQLVAPLSRKLFLRVDSSAQYSTKPLLASEEFALGGSRIGRAFDFNTVTGDSGVGGMIELGYRVGNLNREVKGLELFTYVDGGGASRRHPSPGAPGHQWLASSGAGMRFTAAGMIWSGELGLPVARGSSRSGVRAFFSLARVL
jgi:hemolysin activation/secretion protein